VELGAKLIPVLGWVQKLPAAELPASVKKRMISFSGQNMILLILNVVVWNRSDMVFLRILQSERVNWRSLRGVQHRRKAFSGAANLRRGRGREPVFRYGRDRQKLLKMTTQRRSMCTLRLPMLAGAARSEGPHRHFVWTSYLPMVRVFQVMAIFAIPRLVFCRL